MIIVLQPSHIVLLHEPHWVILVTWVWCRPPQRPFRVPGASEWIPRTSKTQHWKHGDRPPEYSKYAVSVMALYRSAGSACFVKDIALDAG